MMVARLAWRQRFAPIPTGFVTVYDNDAVANEVDVSRCTRLFEADIECVRARVAHEWQPSLHPHHPPVPRSVAAMTEPWKSTTEGRHLAGRVKVSTQPELALRAALHRAGFRFRLHPRIAKGCTPDLVLPRHRLAVFVDGCFWHGCPQHGRKAPWTGPNAELWAQKMTRNAERDARSTKLAQDVGWTVVRIWEHEVRTDVDAAVGRVRAACLGESPGAEAR